uniref:B box-type domain-containing protein n=1 Tax=Magallana gigas TaxID=29159 RepID=A0A8W8HM37_MAGGI
MAQDPVRCSLCPEVVVIHCGSCQVNLCAKCLSTHIDRNKSLKHEIVPYTSQLVKPEAEIQKCRDHPKQQCDLFCQDCSVPICSRCLTGNHKRHGAVDLEEICETTRSTVKEDLEELRKFRKEYEKVVGESKEELAKYIEESDKERDSLKELGKQWHQMIDKVIDKVGKDMDEIIQSDTKCLQDNTEEIQSALQDVKDSIKANEDILQDDRFTRLLSYASKNDAFRIIPSRPAIKTAKIVPVNVKEGDIIPKLIHFQRSICTKLPGYSLNRTGDVSSISTKSLLPEPELIATVKTNCKQLKGICHNEDDRVWIYGTDEILREVDITGTVQNCITAISKNSQKDIAKNKMGEIVFSHLSDECVNIVREGKISKLLDLSGWIPFGVTFNADDDLMVCMRREDYQESKVGIFSQGKLKKEIQFDETGKPLFSASRNNMYIKENANRDICVSDWNACAVIVLKSSGELRFRYTGNLSRSFKQFYPHGIVTDNYCRILVVDRKNDCLHVIDRNGKFLTYITCSLQDPYVLSMDPDENVWVGEYDTGCVKVIRYLEC